MAEQSRIEKVAAKLKVIRQRKDLKLKPTKHLKQTYTDFSGEEKVLTIRYYQVQGILHLLFMKRFLLGDDTGLGKTLQAIAALCYIWAKDPSRKVLVLTTKSATPQWAKEFAKFTKGVRVIVAAGTRKQREKAYTTWRKSSKPTVMIMGYRAAVNDVRKLQEDENYILIADECFDYHTPVTLADGSTELIGNLVSQQIPAQVLSWNPVTGVVEPRQIINWFRTPLRKGRRKDLLKISFRLGDSVRVTRSHEFYTPDGTKRAARDLRKGSVVQCLCPNTPTQDQWQVILGGLLGDASLSHPKRPCFGVCFTQSTKQGEYLRFKQGVLRPLGVSDITTGDSGYEGAPVERFRLHANRAVVSTLVQSRVWRGDKKRVTADWLNLIGPLGLAVWYGDDGSLGTHLCKDGRVRHTITLHTQGFSKDEQELLVGWLRWRWHVRAQIKTTKPRSDRDGTKKSYPYLYLATDEAAKFLALMPGALPGVEYKFPNKDVLTPSSLSTEPYSSVVTDWVAAKQVWTPQAHQKYVYDIEVESHHNYFAGGGLVSNCTAFKNPKTQVHQCVRHFSEMADRTWALTATLIKNNLMEGHGIYQVVVPGLFKSADSFMRYYCIIEMMQIGRGRKVPRIVGYYPEKVVEFREVISPYYYGRPKHEVAVELPALTREIFEVGLSPAQEAKYQEALTGLLYIGEKRSEGEEEKEITKLTALIYLQQIVNHPDLIECEGSSNKLDVLLDMLTSGDLAGENVIIFSRFKKMVNLLIPALKKVKIDVVRVTGDESGPQRQKAQDRFQDPDDPCNVICITMAGGDAINLQTAKAIIFYDTPWSAGDYIQCLDDQTEILTPEGFKSRGGIQVSDLVGSFARHTSEIQWTPVLSVVDRPKAPSEQMYELKSPHLDIRVTGGHQMLFKRPTRVGGQKGWPSEWRLETVQEMSQEASEFRIPASGVQKSEGVPLTNDELRFIGWFLTDGTMNKSTQQVSIVQATHQPQIHDLRHCLAGCGFDWSEYDRDPNKIAGSFPNGKPQIVFSVPKGVAGGSRARNGWVKLQKYLDKDFSPHLEQVTPEQLAVLLEAIHFGDGAKQLGQSWTRRSYHIGTAHLVFAERLQSLCVRRGFRCNLSQTQATFWVLHIKPTSCWSLNGNTKLGRPRFRVSPSTPNESVWCVENEEGTLICRRKGKVFITGNCIGRMIRIGSQHDNVLALHLVAKSKKEGKTIDHRVMDVIGSKMKLIEAVLGERLRGTTRATGKIDVSSDVGSIFDLLTEDARSK